MSPQPPVAIIVPLFNDAATIEACLRGVLERTDYPSWELIVVDDGSTDKGPEIARRFPNVRVVDKTRGGIASALNAGFAAVPGADVVRLHADVVVDSKDWLARLAEAAYAQPKAGVVGVRLVYPDGRICSEGRHFVSGLGMHPQHHDRRAFQPDGAPGRIQEVDSVSGALAFYRRAAIDKVGGLDDGFGPAWMEDDDFCIGARHAGFKVYVHAGVKAVHYTRGQSPTFQTFFPNLDGEFRKVTSHTKLAARHVQAGYWESKWGWNPLFPDLGEIRRLYADTEICWQIGEPMRFKPSSAQPTVDCCLVTWNSLSLLRRCLESLARTDYPAGKVNVYIADNASTDGTVPFLQELAKTFPFPLHIVPLAVNTGAPVGMNFAFVQGRGELVARLDDDIVLPPEWLKMLAGDLVQRPFAGCIGPKIINDDPTQSIQCGPYRHFPAIFGHDDEVDSGQADYVARTTHVRGCCNLYRRDTFAKCGLLDARFGPSQFDDPDHHVALLQAGFEILYDGRVGVVHKLNSGLGRTQPAISNQMANYNKLRGKWGQDVYEVLERALDFSREGRYLPDDWDARAWLEQGPSRADFPRRNDALAIHTTRMLIKPYVELCAANVEAWADEHITLAKLWCRNHATRRATDILHAAANLAPHRADVLAALAQAYASLGQLDLARAIARNGLNLDPENGELREQLGPKTDTSGHWMLARVNAIGEQAVTVDAPNVGRVGEGLRVLMVNTYENRFSGGDMHQVKKTRQYLQQLGVHVDICCSPRPDPRGYDLVHVWNTWFPVQTLAQVKAIRSARPNIPIVLSPIFWDMREKHWADLAVPNIFSTSSPAQLAERLNQLATGTVQMNGRTRLDAGEPNFHGYERYQKALFSLVDHLLPQSRAEMANLKKVHDIEKPHTLVFNTAETAVFDQATPDWFVQNFGVKDFVLVVGLVEPRKNQLMLLHALQNTGLPVVIVGRYYDDHYYRLCQKFAPGGTVFIEHLPHEQLASAFKAAKVHALPSWMECASFANIEAALSGCALAVSDRTSEREYFGANAYYCDPASIASIRTAITSAYNNHAADADKRSKLSQLFRTQHTWKTAAANTLAGYRAAIASIQKQMAAA